MRERLLTWGQQTEFEENNHDLGLSNDRAEDNWKPLISIAESLGDEWLKKARKAMFLLENVENEDGDLKIMLLKDIKECFEEKEIDRTSTSGLVNYLNNLSDRP